MFIISSGRAGVCQVQLTCLTFDIVLDTLYMRYLWAVQWCNIHTIKIKKLTLKSSEIRIWSTSKPKTDLKSDKKLPSRCFSPCSEFTTDAIWKICITFCWQKTCEYHMFYVTNIVAVGCRFFVCLLLVSFTHIYSNWLSCPMHMDQNAYLAR
jgi:hypothetical protein